MLLLQGLADRVVQPRNARSLAAALQRMGEPVVLKLYPDVGHATLLLALSSPLRDKAPALADCLAFIQAHAHAAPEAARGGSGAGAGAHSAGGGTGGKGGGAVSLRRQ
jgi:hypothetical protein